MRKEKDKYENKEKWNYDVWNEFEVLHEKANDKAQHNKMSQDKYRIPGVHCRTNIPGQREKSRERMNTSVTLPAPLCRTLEGRDWFVGRAANGFQLFLNTR